MRIENTGTEALPVTGSTTGAAIGIATPGREETQQSASQDTASLSSSSLVVPSLAEQALSTAEARASKVEALRQAIASASYAINPDLIADAMLNEGF